MKITMIGSGYVGLVSGTCFAQMGFDVTCVDTDAGKINNLKQGLIPIYEPGLDAMVKENVAANRLHFTTDLSTCVGSSDAVFIAVGTPQDEDGSADLKYVFTAAEQIAKHLDGYTVVIDKSTVPVGTGRKVLDILKRTNPQADVDVVSNPEFLREGAAIDDFMAPDRIVIGTDSERATNMMQRLYAPLTSKGAPLLATGIETAELIKYAANGFLAMKITFINEMARLAEKLGADVLELSKGIGTDKRIGSAFLNPGPGYGGSCFPKDTNALARTARDAQQPLSLIEATIKANDAHKQAMVEKIVGAVGDVNGKTIAALGLAFKANTDDMRDAAALTILPALAARGATIVAHDPEAMDNAKRLMPNIAYVPSLAAALKNADAAIVLTEWDSIKKLTAGDFRTMKKPLVVDLRNLYAHNTLQAEGITVIPLGRAAV